MKFVTHHIGPVGWGQRQPLKHWSCASYWCSW